MVKSISNLSSVAVAGLDTAKNVFHVHCVDADGLVVVAKALRRAQVLNFFASLPPCLVGIEVYCGTVVRQLAALAQAAKGKVAAGVGSMAGRDIVCSSLTLAGVLYPWRATSQVSL